MIALDFNDTVFQGPTGTALLLELFGQSLNFISRQGDTSYGCYAFPFTSLGLAPDPDYAIIFYLRDSLLLLFTT